VSIGATLAAARRRAGLTVGDVSQQTRVTEPIIRGIEQDDYAACGGDFYARGHIRAIARAVGEDPVPLIDEFDSAWRSEQEITAAQAFQPSMPLRTRERRRVRWTAVLAVLVLAVLGFACYKFIAGVGGQHRAAAGAPPSAAGGHRGLTPASAPAVQGSTARAGPTAASPTPSASSPSPAPVQALAPASVAAFGPAGLGSGDDPQGAALAVAGDPARPWISQWYATARFGALKTGTGLLLDMGRPVTVASVRVWLVSRSGADIELRAGSRPVLSWLPRVASAANAGGTVPFRLGTPVHVRYLLIWFTRLPPDNAGTYRASVYRITVQGHR
jgi:cytoskeletal protein RodZ